MISSRERRVPRAIRAVQPLDWRDAVWLIGRLAGEVEERRGSRTAFFLRGKTVVFHCPHPGSEMGRAQVRDLKGFLKLAGVL